MATQLPNESLRAAANNPEPVRAGDALLMPPAHKEIEERQFGVVNIQPGFQQGSSGLEAARK